MKYRLLIVFSFFGFIILADLHDQKNSNVLSTEKYLTLSTEKDYDKEWNQVDSLIDKGLPKSALEIVNKIYEKAKLERNTPQFIKSIIYRLRLKSEFEEDFVVKTIADLNDEIEKAGFPASAILHSITAEIYWRYYEMNRYRFLNRSITEKFDLKDIKTWDLKKIVAMVINHYRASVENKNNLQKLPLNNYDVIIEKAKDSRKYRPTLYDFLAHRAVDFFMSEEPFLTQAADRFQLNDPEYLNPANDFIKMEIKTTDTFSYSYYAISLLKDLLSFHVNDADPLALIDVDLKRLGFVKRKAVFENIDSLYIASLKILGETYKNHEGSADVNYEMANEYYRKGQSYNPGIGETNKWYIKDAHQICQEVIEMFPATNGANNCRLLLEKILKTSLNLVTEDINLPDKPFLGLLSYRNIPQMYFRIIRMDPETDRNLRQNTYGSDLLEIYLKYKPIKEWGLQMIDDGDFQEHSVEIKIPELDYGYYVILAADNPEFSYIDKSVAYCNIWISGISFISRQNNHAYEFFVLDREKGTPLKDVMVQTYYRQYNYNSRKYETLKWKSAVTDKEGYFMIPPITPGNDNKNFYLEFIYKNDHLITEGYFYMYPYRARESKKTLTTFFFTDRAIYRPGQTVYFKGIILEKDKDQYQVKATHKTRVTFYDVNHQEIHHLNLVTNDYGSFNGSFVVPSGVLTGLMHISNESGRKEFSVEEYKRPKFEVSFDPVKGNYKLEEQVTVNGNARAYAGNAIDNAQVTFRVVRSAFFPYWRYWWWGYYPSSPEMEVTNGSTTTNGKGEFTVEFKAIADKNLSKAMRPVFNYTIYADVTDINDETRSSQLTVRVSDVALLIDVNIPGEIDKDTKEPFMITSTNLNQEKVNARINLKIYKLKQPERIFRERKWSKPDKYLMKKEDFYALFPLDQYDDENNKYKWEKGDQMVNVTVETRKDSVLSLEGIDEWPLGEYVVEMQAKDIFGTAVEKRRYFTVFDDNAKHIPDNAIAWFRMLKNKAEPGEAATFIFGSKDKNLNVLYEIEHQDVIISKQWLKISSEQKLFSIPIEEKHRGNISYHITFIKDNRDYHFDKTVVVPYTNRQLNISFETFRNKLLPGQEEEWRIKINDHLGEKVAAEMLASMYDASLDAFASNYWTGFGSILKIWSGSLAWNSSHNFKNGSSILFILKKSPVTGYKTRYYDQLNWFGFNIYNYGFIHSYRGLYKDRDMPLAAWSVEEKVTEETVVADESENMKGAGKAEKLEESDTLSTGQPSEVDFEQVSIRKNFNETAFFFPELLTDQEGSIILKFTVPEALTRWKMMGFAYTRDLNFGQVQKELVTQKDLMIMPNAPRFFREGDQITFNVKISNISEEDLKGDAQLMLFDALSMRSVDIDFGNKNPLVGFTVMKGQSTSVSWKLKIPEGISAIIYRLVAKAGEFSDGEEMAIPVLTNRMLVTESLPLPVKGKTTKSFSFNKLLQSGSSTTIRNEKLTLEYTSNPAWYAVQALPYLMEYPYECAEQIFSRFYANSIASYIVNSSPRIKQVFDTWKNFQPDALLSSLEKNQELKSLLLEETPWVLAAKDETARKKRVALLFDLNKMSAELGNAVIKLQKMQSSNGGWPWFEGMPESRYITQHIVCGFGHLDHLGIKNIRADQKTWSMIINAVRYLDDRIREDYEYYLKISKDTKEKYYLNNTQIHYLYARTYFMEDVEISQANKTAFNFFIDQAKRHWLKQNRYMQGMIALAMHRTGEKETAADIIKSLKEKALYNEELGMYWRDESYGYFWYQAPIETQALLIETFEEVAGDKESVDEMRVWLLKQKQTQDWKTTKATVEACYALLLRGTEWLANTELVKVRVGEILVDPFKMDDVKVEAGTGYYKTSWTGSDITPEMGNVTVTKTNEGVAWGALYWQYFEQLDKITTHETPLKLDKKLFVQRNTPSGPVIEPVMENTKLKVGDKIKVRIELRVDRDMEYVHMKDMRASAFEPLNVLSGYKFQDGLGYYESTGDAATNFFISYLGKGTYVFEYPLVVSQLGDFSNGITTIQCMYAPEFASHSEGIRVRVE